MASALTIASAVGARPQFVKLAPIARAMTAAGVNHTVIHTGQHYDAAMSDVFFSGLEIPSPDINLNVGSESHGRQTGAMIAGIEAALEEHRPDWLLVYGDTNSTLAAAVAAVKMHIPVAHLEAGLRSHNRRMPEEHNRVLTDHASDLLFAPTALAAENLAREGLEDRTLVVGDVMADVCLAVRDEILGDGKDESGEHLIGTLHRAENTDDPARLDSILSALAEVPQDVRLLAHPRLVAKCDEAGIELDRPGLEVKPPVDYAGMIREVLASAGVVTDSGGLQKEAFLLRRPCTTIRTETEWPETFEAEWNVLAPDPASIREAIARPAPSATDVTPYGDGHAAEKVVAALEGRAQ